jgi:hypothetical protein
MPFTKATSSSAGRKGGKVTSEAKKKAARKNGRKGGRASSRTLAERLLGHKLTAAQHRSINLGNNSWLMQSEVERLLQFFEAATVGTPFDSPVFRRKVGRLPRDVRFIVAKFKLAAEHFLPKAKPPNDYIVVSRPPSPEQSEDFRRLHPDTDLPAPYHRVKVYFTHFWEHKINVIRFRQNPKMTAQELIERSGSEYRIPGLAEAVIEWLRWHYGSDNPVTNDNKGPRWRREVEEHVLGHKLYVMIAGQFSRNRKMTLQELRDLCDLGDGALKPHAKSFLKHLREKFPPSEK